jgi:hypothetical protein
MTLRPTASTTPRVRLCSAALIFSAIAALAVTGCDPRQAMFFLQPFSPKIPAPCPSLKEKRVVILTATDTALQTDSPSIDAEISRQLAEILKKNVKKIDVVDPAQVAAWAQAKPTWTDPAEAARAFEADVVIFLEVREFQIQSPLSPGLFQGRSSIHVQVTELKHPLDARGKPLTDQPKESKVIYQGDRSTNFPVTGHIPMDSGVNVSEFRNRFTGIVVNELSWFFVEHAAGDNIQNTRFD